MESRTRGLTTQEEELDPGAAVARGSPMLVRLYVPLWLVNATTLPVAAQVVPTAPPPRPQATTMPEAGDSVHAGTINAAESIKLRTIATGNPQESIRCMGTCDPPSSIKGKDLTTGTSKSCCNYGLHLRYLATVHDRLQQLLPYSCQAAWILVRTCGALLAGEPNF